MRTFRQRTALALAAAAALGLGLTACGTGSGDKASPSDAGRQSGSKSTADDKPDDKPENEVTGSSGRTKPAGTSSPSKGGGKPGVCTNSETKLQISQAQRPVNYQLITLTNTGSRTCTALVYPTVSFGPDLDGVTETREDTKPQAVVTLKPGEAAYAGLNTSPADQQDDGQKPHASYIAVDLVQSVGSDGSTRDFGQPRQVKVKDLFVYEPTVTAWQQNPDDALV
ncbi:DUF4232 domain-containing protein [Streptomyces sp. T-3]|nr:DUF4232 domain-containing protein [Streptomyces sp. T-3]